MVVFIGGSRFWRELDIYHIEFSAIGGLEKGGAVRLGGLRVGEVLDIAIARDDISKINVTIGVKPGTPIYKGVTASIRTLGLVGDYYVLLTQSSWASAPLPAGGLIPSREIVEMGDLLVKAAELSQTLNSSVEDVVHTVNQILSKENIASVQTALQGMSRLATQGEESLSMLTADLRQILKRIDNVVVNLDSLVIENRENVKHTVLAIKSSAERLEELSLTMNETLAENREDLRSTIRTIRRDTQKAEHLIDNLNSRVSVSGDYLEEMMANLAEISENLKLLSSQLRRQPWRLIYRGTVK
jgi:phospholipid/cholesterol/gamma-HCH transport system substrate-binding protein